MISVWPFLSVTRVPHRLQCGYLLHHGASQSARSVLSTFSHFLSFTFFSPSPALVWCALTFLGCALADGLSSVLWHVCWRQNDCVLHRAAPVLFPQVPPLQSTHRAQTHTTHLLLCSISQFIVTHFKCVPKFPCSKAGKDRISAKYLYLCSNHTGKLNWLAPEILFCLYLHLLEPFPDHILLPPAEKWLPEWGLLSLHPLCVFPVFRVIWPGSLPSLVCFSMRSVTIDWNHVLLGYGRWKRNTSYLLERSLYSQLVWDDCKAHEGQQHLNLTPTIFSCAKGVTRWSNSR